MDYYKFHIDEDDAKNVYCIYRDLSKGKASPQLIRSFPLDLVAEKEPKLLEMVGGDITDVYYEEFNGEVRASEIKWFLGEVEKNSDEDVEWIKNFVRRACIDEEYDELVAPPSVEGDTPLEQKDFLAEFFAELEEDSK